MGFKAVPEEISKEIAELFASTANISYLRAIEVTAEMRYHIKDSVNLDKSCRFNDILHHIFKNYNQKLPKPSIKRWKDFDREIENVKNNRSKAKICFKSPDNYVLFVEGWYTDNLKLPGGDINDCDANSLKVTALREAGEECNIWLKKKEFIGIKEYFQLTDRNFNSTRTYLCDNLFEKNNTENHVRLGEVKKLHWLDRNEIKKRKLLSQFEIGCIFDRPSPSKILADNDDDEKCWTAYKGMENDEKEYIIRKKKNYWPTKVSRAFRLIRKIIFTFLSDEL